MLDRQKTHWIVTSVFVLVFISNNIIDSTMFLMVQGFSPARSIGISARRATVGSSRWRHSLVSRSAAASKESSSSNSKRTRPETSLPPVPEHAHRIVLMRHGESEFNNANIFTVRRVFWDYWYDILIPRLLVCCIYSCMDSCIHSEGYFIHSEDYV